MADETLTLNVDDLDLNEVDEIEEEFGQSLGEIEWKTAKQIRFLVWIFKKRDNPDITIEEAGKQKMTALVSDDSAESEDSDRPTEASAELVGAGAPSSAQ